MNNTQQNSSRRDVFGARWHYRRGRGGVFTERQKWRGATGHRRQTQADDGSRSGNDRCGDDQSGNDRCAAGDGADGRSRHRAFRADDGAFWRPHFTRRSWRRSKRAPTSSRALSRSRSKSLWPKPITSRLWRAFLVKAAQPLPAATSYQFSGGRFRVTHHFSRGFAYTLEEIGIGAYLGAVGAIQDDTVRAAAASIYGAEAQHAALLRTFAGFNFAPRYYEAPLSVEQVTQLISPYILA